MTSTFVNQYVSSPEYQKFKDEQNARIYGPNWCDEFQAVGDAVAEGRSVSEVLLRLHGDAQVRHGNNTKHKKCGTPEYMSWRSMRGRCLNPNDDAYPHYGGRGITICERWESFENFLTDMGPRPAEHSLDQIDPDGNYEASNCRWADDLTQGRNRRGTRYYKATHGPEWNRRRAAAIEAADSRCQVCYSPDDLHVHHRTYKRLGAELPGDLTVLCKTCHNLFHTHKRGIDK